MFIIVCWVFGLFMFPIISLIDAFVVPATSIRKTGYFNVESLSDLRLPREFMGTKYRQQPISSIHYATSENRDGECDDSAMIDVDDVPVEETAFDKVAAMGLAGVLAIAAAEAMFWLAGMPLAEIYYKWTSGEFIDLTTSEGQLQAAGFSFGYGGFATLILQYRVTLFAIPLVPVMDKYVVKPLQSRNILGNNSDE